MFQYGVSRIFGSKEEEVTGDWGKLHYEELCNGHTSLNIIKMVKLVMR
jgi:hypothetical protein